jgi:tRNA dimethylallyltransferase
VITGPTASGKTGLAIELAKHHDGEIICADSRTIYTGMDIGTAKPSAAERALVPHWGLDLVEPSQSFSAADFKKYAQQKIEEIRSRGHVPFLVGGTGLYIDAVVFDYQFGPVADPAQRAWLEGLSLEELYVYCKENNILLPENHKNKRYVVRAIERGRDSVPKNVTPISTTIIVGIATGRDALRRRIAKRTEQLFEDGVVSEATLLGEKYGWDSAAMTGNIYPLVHSYLLGELTLEEAKIKNTTSDWRLAKRQLTWMRRNSFIEWLPLQEAKHYLEQRLANEN